uniref:Carboxylic ester hydrolase n=1 Tax=Caenorhabditis japonica TaxID=281687 RepID=A0A8R1DSE9_CAEJA
MGAFYSKHHHLTPVHEATCGPVLGVGYNQEDGSIVEGYLGIPYAEPPVGPLRFKKPVEHEKWDDPLECTRFGARCPQNDELLGQFVNTVGKSEDECLSLNVFTPTWTSDEWPSGFPVMVFIHGGGFAVHSSSNYGCATIARNLCTKNVVVVTINYRLGVLGFFTTGDDVCRGNMGLWDQTLALQWVQKHIASFRGDPNNVTIFGQSAGGASVDLLCLSPHSRHLFQRAIPMAGNGECDFAVRTNEQQAKLSKEFAHYLGWQGEDTDTEGLLDFIDSQPIYKIEMGINPKRGFQHSQAGNLYFVPNFDGDFFPKPLSELRKEVPRKQLMTGTTKFEGLFFVALGALSRNQEGIKKFMSRVFKECDYGNRAEEALDMAYDFYFKGVHPKDSEKTIQQIVKFVGDYSINFGTYKYVNEMTKLKHDVYFYSFEYHNPSGFGIFKWLLPFLGSTHCTEMRYVLGKGIISKFRPNEHDKKMIEAMTTYFTNFAKYGNPSGQNGDQEWEKHDSNHPFRHFKIDLEEREMTEDYQERRAELWEKMRALNLTRKKL